MYFRVNELEVGVNGSIVFGNEQQKVYCLSEIACNDFHVRRGFSSVALPSIALLNDTKCFNHSTLIMYCFI